MRRIGLLGGTSWASTLVYYRLLNEQVAARLGRNHSAELVVWSFDFQRLLDLLDRPHEIEAAFAEAGDALARAGCEVVAVASNTGHRFAGPLARDPRFALVHIGDAVGRRLAADGVRRAAVLATLQTLGDDALLGRLTGPAAPARLPPGVEERLDAAIFGELAHERLGPDTAAVLDEAGAELARLDADATLLACTELSFAHERRPFPAPVYDSVRLHCEAILEAAFA